MDNDTKLKVTFFKPYYATDFQFGLSNVFSSSLSNWTLSPHYNGSAGIVEIDISGYKLNRKYVAILVNAVNPTTYDCVGVSEFEVIGY